MSEDGLFAEGREQLFEEGQPQLAAEEMQPDTLQLFEPEPQVGVIASLVDRYMVPPFTILDRRRGYWQERGRQWKGLGIESEIGRDDNLLHMSDSVRRSMAGESMSEQEQARMKGSYLRGAQSETELASGTSIFDPVLCEIAYHWFCPPEGLVLDPFAGGSVRGILAAATGRRYLGIDLSGKQCEANREQAQRLFESHEMPEWVQGDSREILRRGEGLNAADMIFSCPPYGDLEVYSDDPADLSTMDAAAFAETYAEIIHEAVALLAPDRFAAFVIGNYRDKKGMLRDLGGLTVRAFTAAGARFYNDAIILDPAGSASIRASKIFSAAGKLVRVHQQMLVFVKGDPFKATRAIRPPDNEEEEAA